MSRLLIEALAPKHDGTDPLLDMESHVAIKRLELLKSASGNAFPRWASERLSVLKGGGVLTPLSGGVRSTMRLLSPRQSVHWTPTGDGSRAVGVFVRVPPPFDMRFEPLSQDSSPPHVTVLYLGSVPDSQHALVASIVRACFARIPSPTWVVDGVGSFRNSEEWVHFLKVRPPREVVEARALCLRRLIDAGVRVPNAMRAWVPHVTLQYAKPGVEWSGRREHSFQFSRPVFEVWGLREHVTVVAGGPHPPRKPLTLTSILNTVRRPSALSTRLLRESRELLSKSVKGLPMPTHKYDWREPNPNGQGWIYHYTDENGNDVAHEGEEEDAPKMRAALEENEKRAKEAEEDAQSEERKAKDKEKNGNQNPQDEVGEKTPAEGDEENSDEKSEEDKAHSAMTSMYWAWKEIPKGFEVRSPSGAAWVRTKSGWKNEDGVELSESQYVEHVADVAAAYKGTRLSGMRTVRAAFVAFLHGAIRGGGKRNWAMEFEEKAKMEEARDEEARSLARLARSDSKDAPEWLGEAPEPPKKKEKKGRKKKEKVDDGAEPDVVKRAREEGARDAHKEGGDAVDGEALKQGVEGRETTVILPGGAGGTSELKAQYRVVSASDLVPSHDALTFSPREDYKHNNDRDYTKDKGERAKVTMLAQNINPALMLNTDPSASNGPPIVGEDGMVYSGNGRTMGAQHGYEKFPEKMKGYAEYLKENASQFGLDGKDFDGIQNPVLVRVVSSEEKINPSVLIRQANESLTQDQDQASNALGVGRKISERTVSTLAENLDPSQSLSKFLDSAASRDFLVDLAKDGIIDSRNASRYYTGKGDKQRLNTQGKALVSQALVGKVFGEKGGAYKEASPTMQGALQQSAPYILAAAQYGKGYDLSSNLQTALDAKHRIDAALKDGKQGALTSSSSQEDISRGVEMLRGGLLGDPHPILKDKSARAILDALVMKPGKHDLARVFRTVATAARDNPEGQGGLFGATDPSEVFHSAMSRALGLDTKAVEPTKPVEEPVAPKAEENSDQGGLFKSQTPWVLASGLEAALGFEPLLKSVRVSTEVVDFACRFDAFHHTHSSGGVSVLRNRQSGRVWCVATSSVLAWGGDPPRQGV